MPCPLSHVSYTMCAPSYLSQVRCYWTRRRKTRRPTREKRKPSGEEYRCEQQEKKMTMCKLGRPKDTWVSSIKISPRTAPLAYFSRMESECSRRVIRKEVADTFIPFQAQFFFSGRSMFALFPSLLGFPFLIISPLPHPFLPLSTRILHRQSKLKRCNRQSHKQPQQQPTCFAFTFCSRNKKKYMSAGYGEASDGAGARSLGTAQGCRCTAGSVIFHNRSYFFACKYLRRGPPHKFDGQTNEDPSDARLLVLV